MSFHQKKMHILGPESATLKPLETSVPCLQNKHQQPLATAQNDYGLAIGGPRDKLKFGSANSPLPSYLLPTSLVMVRYFLPGALGFCSVR